MMGSTPPTPQNDIRLAVLAQERTVHANATAPFSRRPPSPPYIHIPSVNAQDAKSGLYIRPSKASLDPSDITSQEFDLITNNPVPQVAKDCAAGWKYEQRRQAQRIIDYLYLGPSAMAKDTQFLRSREITMVLGVRDEMLAQARLVGVARTAGNLGIQVDSVDVLNRSQLAPAIRWALRKINAHMLHVHRSSDGAKRGKVLVYCETGNDRSAAIVAAYLMTMFGLGLVTAIQFVSMQRFCVAFEDDVKFVLKAYEDVLQARRMVSEAQGQSQSLKRGVEDMLDMENATYDAGGLIVDHDRLVGRDFAPFQQDGNQ